MPATMGRILLQNFSIGLTILQFKVPNPIIFGEHIPDTGQWWDISSSTQEALQHTHNWLNWMHCQFDWFVNSSIFCRNCSLKSKFRICWSFFCSVRWLPAAGVDGTGAVAGTALRLLIVGELVADMETINFCTGLLASFAGSAKSSRFSVKGAWLGIALFMIPFLGVESIIDDPLFPLVKVI
uniref:Uncharacterized protein n=1 Tax=Romanomermis culicivorax TaxID=13658 RepID=A0A915KVP9_ROMCU